MTCRVRGPFRKQADIADVVGSSSASPRQRTVEEVRAKYGRARDTYRTSQANDESLLTHSPAVGAERRICVCVDYKV